MTGTTIGGTNLILEIAPPAERPTYIGLSATLLAIPIVLNPLLGGWLVGTFGDRALFAVAMICALGGYRALLGPLHR